jgi:hypothetical protein
MQTEKPEIRSDYVQTEVDTTEVEVMAKEETADA